SRAKLDDALVRFQQASAAVAQLEKEQTEKAEAAETLRAQAQAAERLRAELAGHQQSLTAAQEKLATVTADADQLVQLRRQIEIAATAIATAERTASEAKRRAVDLRARLDATQT